MLLEKIKEKGKCDQKIIINTKIEICHIIFTLISINENSISELYKNSTVIIIIYF